MRKNETTRLALVADDLCRHSQSGFSVVELLTVVAVLFILTAMSLPYIYSSKRLYKSEDQALKVLDLMQEARGLALAKRRTFRFEIDLTANAALIIDEAGAAPDVLVKSITLERPAEVRVDAIPAGVSKPNPPNYNNAVFANDSLGHLAGGATVINNNVWAARFRSDGSVVNAASVPVSANLYFWPPVTPGAAAARSNAEVRAVTLFGGSAGIRYWKYNGATWLAY